MSALTNSHLHLHFRLCLEYKLYDISRIALCVLTGDEKLQRLLDAFDECTHALTCAEFRPLQSQSLRTSHEAVLGLARYHLRNACDACVDQVRQTQARLVTCTQSMHRQCSSAERLFERTRDSATYTDELRRLQHDLDTVLETERSRKLPDVKRSEPFARHVKELQNTFQTLVDSKTHSWRALERDKKNIHGSLLHMQQPIAKKFLEDIKECIVHHK